METHISYQYSDRVESDHDSLQILEGILKEVDDKGHKMFKKMVEKDVPMREILHEFHGKYGSDHMLNKIAKKLNKIGEEYGDVSGERGVDGEEMQEDKLERFKVKTVNAIGAGVVKEEEH